MVTTAEALEVLFPSATPLRDYVVEDAGAGQAITAWNLQAAQPTAGELAAVTGQQLADLRSARTGSPVLRHAMVRLSANRVNSTNVLADVTGLSFQLKPNTHYAFSFTGAYTASAGTVGLSLAVSGPAAPSSLGVVGCVAESAVATRQGVGTAYDAALTGTTSGGATRMPFWVDGNITTGAAGGTFTLRFASEVNGSAVTILAGSMAELKEVGG